MSIIKTENDIPIGENITQMHFNDVGIDTTLFSLTVKNAALLTICIYCYKGRAVTNVGRTCSPTLL